MGQETIRPVGPIPRLCLTADKGSADHDLGPPRVPPATAFRARVYSELQVGVWASQKNRDSRAALWAKLSHSTRNLPTLFYTSSMATSNPSPEQPVTAVTWEIIVAAHERIKPRIHRTPVLTSSSIDAIAGAQLFFKCDNFQKTGSFKIRGATNAVFSLTEEEARRGVVCHSSGNHAAALACAAAWRGIPAWIVMPSNSSA